MYQPETYGISLSFMIASMFCWGSWANTVKLCPGYRFQLFYWDYVVGLILGALLWGFTLGSAGPGGRTFIGDLAAGNPEHVLLAIAGGVIFNLANLLLVAAIEIAGLAVAFPVGIGLALVVGAISSYIVSPHGNPLMLFSGIALVIAAIVCDALAYRLREYQSRETSRRGVVISLISGLLMGSFYPFVARAMSGPKAPGPYAAAAYFVVGVAICAVPFNFLLMRRPLDSQPAVSFRGFTLAHFSWHMWGIVGGFVWCTGAVLNFVAARSHVVGPAVSYSVGQGATMVSAAWGVFIWREFSSAPSRAKEYLFYMFALFLLGLTLVATAPLF